MNTLFLATDHGGYTLKEHLKTYLTQQGHTVIDLGCDSLESVDYPDYAKLLAEKVLTTPNALGIGLCGTGTGMAIALNRFKGIRASRAVLELDAEQAREHGNANCLVLGGRITTPLLAERMVDLFVKTPFQGERHLRRIQKLDTLGA